MPIEIGLVEDDVHVREGMQRVIASMPQWQLRFACGSLREARRVSMTGVQLLLLDIGLPDGCGLDLLADIAGAVPVLVISAIGDESTVVRAIEQGAAGYLLKDARPKDLIDSILAVLAGGAPISPGVASYLLRRLRDQRRSPAPATSTPLESLTARETEVLRALTRGGAPAEDEPEGNPDVGAAEEARFEAVMRRLVGDVAMVETLLASPLAPPTGSTVDPALLPLPDLDPTSVDPAPAAEDRDPPDETPTR